MEVSLLTTKLVEMQQFDTITLAIPEGCVRESYSDTWIETRQTDRGTGETVVLAKISSDKLPIGVSQLSWREGGDYLLTYSAKVLGSDYLDGINKNNWHQGLEAVAPFIQTGLDLVYRDAVVTKCDTTNNISLDALGGTMTEVCQSMLSGKRNNRFKEIPYHTKKKQGVEFRGTQEEKNRLIGYSKKLDLLKPANRNFLRSINDSTRLIDMADKQIRIEVNHTTHNSIRDRLGIPDIRLPNVLNSTNPVNQNFLNKILNPGKKQTVDLFVQLENFEERGFDKSGFVYMVGIQTLIEWSDYSEEPLKALFQRIYPNNNTFKYHWFKKSDSIKKILESMKCKQFGLSVESVNNICNRLLNELYLSVAA